ncbi:hypothetical protein TNCV_4010531 [Trichonephila clavipes]|nr:hypothetical protein TNCV_4010531 [Trichonephila clavipes]
MELGRKQGESFADPLLPPIRDYWERRRRPPRRFKGPARKLTGFSFNHLQYLQHHFFLLRRHTREVVGTAAPVEPNERNCDDFLKKERERDEICKTTTRVIFCISSGSALIV